jgi:hypothetical protein
MKKVCTLVASVLFLLAAAHAQTGAPPDTKQQDAKPAAETNSRVSTSSSSKENPIAPQAALWSNYPKSKVNPACTTGSSPTTSPCGEAEKRGMTPVKAQPQDPIVNQKDLDATPAPADRSPLDPIASVPLAIGPEYLDVSLINLHGVQTAVRNLAGAPPRLQLAAATTTGPSMTSFTPSFGNPGTAVTIVGSGFGAPLANSYVQAYSITTHTNFLWAATSWTDTQIIVDLPADMPIGECYFNVYVAGVGIPGTNAFTVGIPPVFSSYAPTSGAPGTLIKIQGSGFGQLTNPSTSYVAARSSVTYETTYWTPTSWTDTEIDVKVPDGFPQGMVWLYVSVAGLASIGTNPFTVGVPPVIDCYSPLSGPPGTLVTLNGSGFRSTQGSSSVLVLSSLTNTWTSWPVSTWSATQITLPVPANTPLGLYYFSVDVDKLQSIGTNPFQVGFPPIVTDYTPLWGNPGTQVVINGSGFGSTQGTSFVQSVSAVTNNRTVLPVNSWSDTQVVVTIPATMPLGEIYLTVGVGALESIGTYPFTVGIPPFITSYSPNNGPAGTIITINGTGFGAAQGSGSVMLQSVTNIHTALTVLSWSDTQVTVSIPALTPTCLSYLSIGVDGLSSIGTYPFQVTSN